MGNFFIHFRQLSGCSVNITLHIILIPLSVHRNVFLLVRVKAHVIVESTVSQVWRDDAPPGSTPMAVCSREMGSMTLGAIQPRKGLALDKSDKYAGGT